MILKYRFVFSIVIFLLRCSHSSRCSTYDQSEMQIPPGAASQEAGQHALRRCRLYLRHEEALGNLVF